MKIIQERLYQLLKTVPKSKMLEFTQCRDAPFEHFKQSANEGSQTLHCIDQIHSLKREIAFSNIMEIAPDLLMCSACVDI